MAPQINGVVIPTGMATRGKSYEFVAKPVVGKNGKGQAVTLPYAMLTWEWDVLETTEWEWWTTTLLGGAASASFTGVTKLQDDDAVEQTFNHAIVHRPTGKLRGNHFVNVKVVIEQLS